ncbi:MAG TPA: hypothetical protein EYG92_07425 [Lutibacter sp.]|nr:hypothetical protein [Lutibacter sp.]
MNSKYEQIEKYWQGKLEGSDLKAFEKQMQVDANFAEEVGLYKEIEKSIAHRFKHQKKESELRTTLNKIQKEQDFSKKTSKVIPLMGYKKWLVAASIAVLVGLFFFQNDTATYSDYANHEPMEVSVRGNSSTLDQVQKLFNEKDYLLANTHLSRLADFYKDNAEIQLYYGITFLETDQYEMAKMTFEKIADGNSLFKYKATWYLALNALKQNDIEASKHYLKQIPEEAAVYDKAKSLLDKL